MFDDSGEDRRDAAIMDYYENVLDTETKPRDFGRERGLSPVANEAQNKAIKRLASKLVYKSVDPKDDGEGVAEAFDIMSSPRVILYEGKVLKRSAGVLQMNQKRQLYLLNDYLLICSLQSSGGIFSKETYLVHAALNLNDVSFVNLSVSNSVSEDNSCVFDVIGAEKQYSFIAESESDKRIWLEELEAAIFCIKLSKGDYCMVPGWRHMICRGTFHSAVMNGDIELTKAHIKNLGGANLDIADDGGMYPLHLAAMKGHLDIVELLVQHGANVDILNHGLNSPMMLAAANGHDTVVIFLLNHHANFTLRNIKDRDALFMAVLYAYDTRGLYHIITVLTNKGVNLNQVDCSGATPLHECAARNLSHPVLLLVDAGANVNTKHSRNGLTPLQIACAVERPDIETIQSFLDKGAHANWKDVSKLSAFDLVLRAHSERISKISSSAKMEKGALNEMDVFVQFALPVLMELVRKGCRYDSKSVQSLRSSFVEAISTAKQNWLEKTDPEGFLEFVQARGEQTLLAKTWVSDSASKHCLLCQDQFNYSNRRHHCRGCGILCCDLCSSKSLIFKASVSPSKSSKSKPEAERVCDSCFNSLYFQCTTRQMELAKAKRELEKQEAKMKEEEQAALQKKSSVSIFGGNRDKSASVSSVSSTGGGGGASASATAAIASETLQNLEERGQKLQNAVDKSEQMLDASKEFNKSAKELLRRQREKAARGGW
jgi:ankyrin repeat protein